MKIDPHIQFDVTDHFAAAVRRCSYGFASGVNVSYTRIYSIVVYIELEFIFLSDSYFVFIMSFASASFPCFCIGINGRLNITD